jgi:hypothetical protein
MCSRSEITIAGLAIACSGCLEELIDLPPAPPGAGAVLLAVDAPGRDCRAQSVTAYDLAATEIARISLPSDHRLVALFYSSLADLHLSAGLVTCTSSAPSRGLLPALANYSLDRSTRGWAAETSLPPELLAFRFAQPAPPSLCVGHWKLDPSDLPNDSKARNGLLIEPGRAWLALDVAAGTSTGGRVAEIRCPSVGPCQLKDLPGLASEKSARAMFRDASGDVWLLMADGCLLRSHASTATVAERHCAGAPAPYIYCTLDGPTTSTEAFELFAACEGAVRYHAGQFDLLPIGTGTGIVIRLGPGEALFPTSASTGPLIVWHRASDGTIAREPLTGAIRIWAGRFVPGLGPILAASDTTGAQVLFVRQAGAWAFLADAPTAAPQSLVQALLPFRDGLLYGGSDGTVGQISSGSACEPPNSVPTNENLHVLIDLGLPDHSILTSGASQTTGTPAYVFRVTPLD